MYISNFLGANGPAVASGGIVAGEAVLQGQLAVIGADGLAYYASDPLASVYALNNMRPVSALTTLSFPLLQATSVPAAVGGGVSTQSRTTMAKLSNGNIAVLSPNSSQQLYLTIFNTTGGVAAGSTLVGTCQAAYAFPTMTALTGGGVVIAWSTAGAVGANPPQFAIYSNTGTVVTATTSFDPTMVYCYGIEVCPLSSGGFAIAYHGGTTAGAGITQPKHAVYTATGGVTLAPAVLATNSSNVMPANIGGVAIAQLAGTVGYVVAYLNLASSTTGQISFQRFNNAGALQGAATAVSGGGITITGVSAVDEMVHVVALTGGGFAIEYHVTTSNYSIWNGSGVQQGSNFSSSSASSGSLTSMLATSDGGVAIMTQVSGALNILKYSAAGVSGGTTTLSTTSNGNLQEMVVLADNTILCVWNEPTSVGGIAILNSTATAIVSQGTIANFAPLWAAYMSKLTPVQVTNASKSTAVTYAFIGVYNGTLSLVIATTTIQKFTPVGVYAAPSAQGATVSIQYTGFAQLISAFLQPYVINAQGNTPPGQKMNILGNSCQMYGIQ